MCSHPRILRRTLVHQEALLVPLLLLPLFDLAHLFLLVRVGVGVLAGTVPLAHIVEIWLLDAHLGRRQAARVLLLRLLVVRVVALILLRLVLALRGGSLASRRLVLRAAHVRVHCVGRVAAVGEDDVAIRRLVVVAAVLLHAVLLLHAPDNVPRSVHEIDHLPHLAAHGLLLWRIAALGRRVQLRLTVLVAARAPLGAHLVLRPRKELLLVAVHDVIVLLLLHVLRGTLLLERGPPHILLHVVVEARRVRTTACWILLLLHMLKLLMWHVLVALIVI